MFWSKAAVEMDDDAMEAYLEGTEPDVDAMRVLIRKRLFVYDIRFLYWGAQHLKTKVFNHC